MVVVYLLFDVSGEKKVIEDIKQLKNSNMVLERANQDLRSRIDDYYIKQIDQGIHLHELQERALIFKNKIDNLESQKELGEEISKLQEHNALIRKDLMELHEKISNKRPLIKMQGPLQVELFTPTKNLGGAGKKSVARGSSQKSQPPPFTEPSVKRKKSPPLFKNM